MGAHAAIADYIPKTCDAAYYRACFPELPLIAADGGLGLVRVVA